jgi:hypothetical protein
LLLSLVVLAEHGGGLRRRRLRTGTALGGGFRGILGSLGLLRRRLGLGYLELRLRRLRRRFRDDHGAGLLRAYVGGQRQKYKARGQRCRDKTRN